MMDLEEYEQVKKFFYQTLQIFFEFNDHHSLGMTIRNIFCLYQKTHDKSIVPQVAKILGISAEELLPHFEGDG